MDTALLAAIFALIGALIKSVLDAILAFYKTKAESSIGANTAASDIRDDILELVTKYEAREVRLSLTIEKKEQQVASLQETIAKLIDENITLRSEKRMCQFDIEEKQRDITTLKKELEKFEKKVYYVRQTKETQEQ